MARMVLVVLLVGLVLAPAAFAKGPHAVLTSGPEPVMPGVPWESTIELNEFRDAPRPLLIAFRDDGHVDADVRRAPEGMARAPRFEATMVYPAAGRWKLMLIVGKRRFSLPALSVGTAEPPKDYVAFPVGSAAARQGGGGELIADEQSVDTRGGDSLPPEVITAADSESEGGGVPVWLFPLLGVVLAGVGAAAAATRRGSRRAPRRRWGGSARPS
jgi:hypothetical protein